MILRTSFDKWSSISKFRPCCLSSVHGQYRGVSPIRLNILSRKWVHISDTNSFSPRHFVFFWSLAPLFHISRDNPTSEIQTCIKRTTLEQIKPSNVIRLFRAMSYQRRGDKFAEICGSRSIVVQNSNAKMWYGMMCVSGNQIEYLWSTPNNIPTLWATYITQLVKSGIVKKEFIHINMNILSY
jgi:hypothetical protein